MTNTTKIKDFSLAIEADRMILKKRGAACSCPFRNPVLLPHPTISGQVAINNPICSSACQFFDVMDEKEDIVVIDLLCADKTISALIEKEKKSDHSRPQDSKIITL